MITVYPISASLCAANCPASWKSAAMDVEYLFMGGSSRNQRQLTEGQDDFIYASIGVLITASKPEKSGRYRSRNAVPT
ncbi:hypothetical protein [Iningainema tapete]|uniref:hypothetical protein n=1 Tax=Iningainema tapete TaxID=2806730 RepID=UPI00192DCBAB